MGESHDAVSCRITRNVRFGALSARVSFISDALPSAPTESDVFD
jgi:hypothetical protein